MQSIFCWVLKKADMNKSVQIRISGSVLILFPLALSLPVTSYVKIVFLIFWIAAVLLYLYPWFFSFLALISHNTRGRDTYLRLMNIAFSSGRTSPKSAATFSYILLKKGDIDKAVEALDYAESRAEEQKRWRKGKVKYFHIHSYRSLILWKQGKLSEATELLIELLDQDYKTSTLYANLGWFLIKMGRYADALSVNLEALEYDRSPAIIDNVGLNYLKLGDLEKSEVFYNELIDVNPQFPDAWFNYGQLLEKTGDDDKAQEMFEKALKCEFSYLGTVTPEEIKKFLKIEPSL